MSIPGNFLSATTESVDPNTSGWTAKLNCTLSKGTGGRNGDGCLTVKSVASGEVQARTVSSYPVTAGTLYQTFSDAAGASVPERIGIRWLTSGGVEISITWSVVTAAASASWHRVGVAGVAPVGATQAQVLLSSTPAAGLVNQFWENVYLGLPIRTTGNLLAFNTESAEVDATGWGVVANSTISRQVPVVTWAVDNYLAGGHTLAMTVVGAGNASVLAVARPTVTPGEEYLAYAYLQPPTSGSTAWIELRFYDAGGSQIAAQKSTLAAPGTGMYRQRASLAAPSNAATCSVAAGLDGASAAQVLRLETVVVTVAPKLQAGSVLSYADSSVEQGVGGWTVTSGVATAARTTPWGSSFFEGAYALAVSSATATASTLRSGRFPAPGGAGLNWRVQVLAHPAAGTWSSALVRIRWYDAANVDLGTSTGTSYGLPGSSWYVLPSDGVAPANATQGAVEVVATASAVSSILHLDQVVLWQVLPQTAVAVADDNSYVELTLRELPLDYLLTVYRVAPDGARTLVRSTDGLISQQVIVSDLMVIEDHEAPIGVPVYYRIEIYDSTGALASTRTSATVTVLLADIQEAWLKDPGNPQRACRVMVQRAPDWNRPIDQASYVVRGRRNKVVLSGKRQGLEGDLAIWTRSDAERTALHLLLDSGNVLLWQANPGMGVADMYVNVAQVPEARVSQLAQEVWRAWTLPLTEADMPVAVSVAGSGGRTWQDVIAEFATCADLLPVYATCEDLLLDRRMG
ncbi:hypothetical protein [Streptomyces sp. B21-083]|uniref:hypothetical protein n=1 Tax=Streptomyces sp. B21-083 TaxID=3039410 RepID=UPI002FF1E78D